MSTLISAKFGILDSIIIHSATDQEVLMIQSLFNDVVELKAESRDSSLFGVATFFLGLASSAFFAIISLSPESKIYYSIWVLAFAMLSLGIYFLWNWKFNRNKEKSILNNKKEQFENLIRIIKQRVPEDSPEINEYEKELRKIS